MEVWNTELLEKVDINKDWEFNIEDINELLKKPEDTKGLKESFQTLSVSEKASCISALEKDFSFINEDVWSISEKQVIQFKALLNLFSSNKIDINWSKDAQFLNYKWIISKIWVSSLAQWELKSNSIELVITNTSEEWEREHNNTQNNITDVDILNWGFIISVSNISTTDTISGQWFESAKSIYDFSTTVMKLKDNAFNWIDTKKIEWDLAITEDQTDLQILSEFMQNINTRVMNETSTTDSIENNNVYRESNIKSSQLSDVCAIKDYQIIRNNWFASVKVNLIN